MLGVLAMLAAKGGGNADTILWIIGAVLVIAGIVALQGNGPRGHRPHHPRAPRGTRWGEHLQLACQGLRKGP
jgi:hypothetical protein